MGASDDVPWATKPEIRRMGRMVENCVSYHLFIIDDKPDGRNRLRDLYSLREAANTLCHDLTKDHIWQRDGFQVELKTEKGLTFLHGATDYGDSVEDEWLIVYILHELTKLFRHLWVRVADADGEFLLIEAAAVLPEWINPEMDKNRVWMHQGKLWLIPTSSEHDEQRHTPASNLTLHDAVEYLKSNASKLIHSPMIEAEAFYRLQKYPEHIATSSHYSSVAIPRKLAYALHVLPRSVAMAVEAFYLRDAISLRSLSTSTSLTFPPSDLVLMSVHFSRVLFAQLKSQRFEPPSQWRNAIANFSQEPVISKFDSAQLEMGLKLTCGFEMLSQNAGKNRHHVVRELDILLQDLAEDGNKNLPTDDEMRTWRDHDRHDNEGWLDIRYEDFERELAGGPAARDTSNSSGFGNVQTQADLRKMVSRFEAFLNDDNAGFDGADPQQMDTSDGDGDGNESDEGSEFEDKVVSFDDEAFTQMMRDVMGLSRENGSQDMGVSDNNKKALTEEHEDDSVVELQHLAHQFEAELKKHGALDLGTDGDKKDHGAPQARRSDQRGQSAAATTARNMEEGVDIDLNLARNILESFKGQGGMAGPASNLLGMMGMTLPRDEDEEGADA